MPERDGTRKIASSSSAMDMNENSPAPAVWNRTTSFRPNMHACLRACKKTTKRKKRIPYQQHPRPRIRTKLLKEKTRRCVRDPIRPPAFPTFASQAGAAACSAFVSQPAYTPPHTPTQTTRKKKKTRARKTHASFFVSEAESRRAPTARRVEHWLRRHRFLLCSTFCLALRRRGTSAVHDWSGAALPARESLPLGKVAKRTLVSSERPSAVYMPC